MEELKQQKKNSDNRHVDEQIDELIIEMQTKGNPEFIDIHYNTNLKPLKIPEYGRMIHQLVDYLKTIEDRDKRNFYAKEIIRLMGLKNKSLRDVPDFQHKLWDHLFIMADFDLDVDTPYEKPTPEKIHQKPDRLPYPRKGYKYRYYGHIIYDLIRKAVEWDGDEETRRMLIMTIANHMKKNYLKWNKESVDDAIIFRHLYELSNGKIDLKPDTDELLRKDQLFYKKKKHHHHKSNKRNNRR